MSSARVIASVSDADSGDRRDSGVQSIVGVIGGQMRAHGDTEQMAALPSPGNMRPVSTRTVLYDGFLSPAPIYD